MFYMAMLFFIASTNNPCLDKLCFDIPSRMIEQTTSVPERSNESRDFSMEYVMSNATTSSSTSESIFTGNITDVK